MYHFLYLIQTAEDLYTNIYKIGRTEQLPEERFKGYKKESYPLRISLVDDSKLRETELKDLFNIKFKLVRGREYFEGNIENMIYEFNKFCNQKEIINNTLQKSDIMKTNEINQLCRGVTFKDELLNIANKNDLSSNFINLINNQLLSKDLQDILYINEFDTDYFDKNDIFKTTIKDILLNKILDLESKVYLISQYKLKILNKHIKIIITSDIELNDKINIFSGLRDLSVNYV
jgi:hypothetical protein